ncbi:MAG: hypothetical protein UH788_06840 [Treponemataceae bacterium]|nr:hypothetical protein [Treponemataceae bacterium]
MEGKKIIKEIKLNMLKLAYCLAYIKEMIIPAKTISMSKDDAMELYTRLNDARDRESKIYEQINDLHKKVSDRKDNIIPELRDFDFELFKVRFGGSYWILSSFIDYLRKKIFCNENEDSIKIYKSFFKHVKSIETEMNLNIELMRLIRDYSDIPENCVSKKSREDFRKRVKHIFQD